MRCLSFCKAATVQPFIFLLRSLAISRDCESAIHLKVEERLINTKW